MTARWSSREQGALARFALRWVVLAGPVAAVIGSACALFLWSLDWVTRVRFGHPWLLYLLPLAGVAIALTYKTVGKSADRGNNLIMDEIHEPGGGVPARMAPLILVATLVTHLFGGSAGREGTAVQMGGALASAFTRHTRRWLALSAEDTRRLLHVGIAAGFAGVFGTPLAAIVFALEVITLGRLSYDALFPCLIGSIVADRVCLAWGIRHTQYHIAVGAVAFEWATTVKVAGVSVLFGLASVLFAQLTHRLQAGWKAVIRMDWLRPVAGAAVVIGITAMLGTHDYLGLGVAPPPGGHVSITTAFAAPAPALAWWWKLLLTAITLSCGFKGGEVTPLFFIGATLGSALAGPLHLPVDLLAGLGFVAVFAGATNTPLACTLMAIELFGAEHGLYAAVACFTAYLFSGHNSIYSAQRLELRKF